jgi:beta-N-acetylhexosaminidase
LRGEIRHTASAIGRRVTIGVMIVAVGCASGSAVPAGDPAPVSVIGNQRITDASTATPMPVAVLEPPRSWEDSVLSSMSLRDKAAQMVWPFTFGDYVADDAVAWRRLKANVEQDHVGGVLISVGSPLEIAAKLNALQQASPVPLLVGADLESGAGFRARGGYFLPNGIDLGGAPVFPPAMALGAAADTSLAYEEGRITAIEGRALGIHVAFSPVLDVNNNPANPVINTRSFGEDPHLAGRLGAAFVRGVQEHGMIATGKHFPGHGDTETNSHLALPVVNATRARLDSVELVPFRAAIAAGVGAIMTFHGAMPALDSTGVPGTLSRPVLTGLLRTELGFNGLIISDAMDMRGVIDTYGSAEAVKRAVAAGADVLLQPTDVRVAIDAVVSGVSEGRYDEARIDASVRRLLAAKRAAGLDRRRIVSLDSARAIVGDSSHHAVAAAVAAKSITLVKDSLNQVPLGVRARGARVLSITVARRADLAAGVAFNAELRRGVRSVRAELVLAEDPAAALARLLRVADSVDVVIVSSYMAQSWDAVNAASPREFVDFVNGLTRRDARPIFVSFGNPYLLEQVRGVPAYLIGWGGFPVSQQAAARALLGSAPIGGRLPIAIPPVAPLNGGLRRGG